jgi:hypothetical protein
MDDGGRQAQRKNPFSIDILMSVGIISATMVILSEFTRRPRRLEPAS